MISLYDPLWGESTVHRRLESLDLRESMEAACDSSKLPIALYALGEVDGEIC